jgi:glycosyltransferase involved in cell wall biosynthesis
MNDVKICFVNPTKKLRRPIADIMGLLLNKGYDISLLWPRKIRGGFDKSWHYTDLSKEINIVPLPSFFMPNVTYPVPSVYSLFRENIKIMKDCDIVHVWSYLYPASVTPLFLKKISKNKTSIVLTVDTFPGYSFQMQNKILDKSFRLYTSLFGKQIFSIPNKVILYCERLKRYAIQVGVPQEKIEVIPTGIDLNKFNSNIDGNQLRNEFAISKDETMILFVGLLKPRKGVDRIIKVMKKLTEKKLNVKMVIVGDGPYRDKYEKMALSYSLKEDTVFTGYRKDIPQLMSACDIFFLPSIGEGLPGVIMEASASCKPTVASNIPCIPDIVEHGKTGFLAEPNNINSFVEYLEILITDEQVREKMGKNARIHIKKFDWKKIIRRYRELYSTLTSY